ncbi:uncharacterized protein LOC127009136 [Eriocheir sinensis]|uniref:uncharacterized protein LOC127009136 n=1 Tax=Eriocheir sinensis TaxID=95602 RepID=UPI0021C5945D|nr:uncharacterized protein LOC127009136 [Eriocheir sinensis]
MKVFLTLLAALAAAALAAPFPQHIAFPEPPQLPQANFFPQATQHQDAHQNTHQQNFPQSTHSQNFPQNTHQQNFPHNTRLHAFPNAVPVESQVWPIIPYSYTYSVSDPETGNYQNKAEMKNDLGEVFGSYSVLMPDNMIYTTIYNVTGTSGFMARVEKSLPQPAGHGSSASSGSSGSSSHFGSFPAVAAASSASAAASSAVRGPGNAV